MLKTADVTNGHELKNSRPTNTLHCYLSLAHLLVCRGAGGGRGGGRGVSEESSVEGVYPLSLVLFILCHQMVPSLRRPHIKHMLEATHVLSVGHF